MDKSLLQKVIDNDNSDFLNKLQNKAKHYNVAIHIGSMVVKAGENCILFLSQLIAEKYHTDEALEKLIITLQGREND